MIKHLILLKIQNMMVWLQWFINSFDKKSSGGAVENENMSRQRPLSLAEELQKPIIRKFRKPKVYLSFIDNIWGTDLAEIQLWSKFYKGIWFLLCISDIFNKYALVIHLENRNVLLLLIFKISWINLITSQTKYG